MLIYIIRSRFYQNRKRFGKCVSFCFVLLLQFAFDVIVVAVVVVSVVTYCTLIFAFVLL